MRRSARPFGRSLPLLVLLCLPLALLAARKPPASQAQKQGKGGLEATDKGIPSEIEFTISTTHTKMHKGVPVNGGDPVEWQEQTRVTTSARVKGWFEPSDNGDGAGLCTFSISADENDRIEEFVNATLTGGPTYSQDASWTTFRATKNAGFQCTFTSTGKGDDMMPAASMNFTGEGKMRVRKVDYDAEQGIFYHDDTTPVPFYPIVPFFDQAVAAQRGESILSATPVFHISMKAIRAGLASQKPFTVRGTGNYDLTDATTGIRTQQATSIVLHVGALPFDAVLKIQDYEKWVPEGPPIAQAGSYPRGNSVSMQVVLIDKKTKKEVGGIGYKTRYTLSGVSKSPGICTNYPLNATPKATDLGFEKQGNPAGSDISADKLTLTTPENQGRELVTVTSYDYGAFGNMRAEVIVNGGGTLLAHVQRPDGSDAPSDTSIPKDENGNHIADAWENAQTSGQPDTWDEDPTPAGQRTDGDGYSFYEEYRGFVELKYKGLSTYSNAELVHTRTNPLQKDVFVWDKDLLVLKFYMATNAAQVAMHFVDDRMMKFNGAQDDPDNRWINFNSTPARANHRQYGMYVLQDDALVGVKYDENNIPVLDANGNKMMEPIAGGSMGRKGFKGDLFDNPLRDTFECRLNLKAIRDIQFGHWPKDPLKEAQADVSANADYITTVIHEIGHYLGCPHHRPPGSKVTIDPANGKGISPETPESVRYGATDCAMRYYSDEELKHWGTTYDPVKSKTRYCRKGDPATDKQGNKIPADNCWGKIAIRPVR